MCKVQREPEERETLNLPGKSRKASEGYVRRPRGGKEGLVIKLETPSKGKGTGKDGGKKGDNS